MTNIEARALANILRAGYDTDTELNRLLAADARAGGRALTEAVAHFAGPAISRKMMADVPDKAWHYHIDPSGAYDWADPRREAEARRAWQRIADNLASGSDNSTYLRFSHPTVSIPQAEKLLDWPIYREALKPQVYVNVSGGIAEATVTRGDAEVIEQDWDNLNDGGLGDYDREDLEAMREKLSGVADPGYRKRLLVDIDEKIDEWDDEVAPTLAD